MTTHAPDSRPVRSRVASVNVDAEPLIYGAVIMMTVMVVGLDDEDLDFGDATGMVLGPMVATALAHLFAASLAYVNRRHSLPSGADLRHLLWHSAHFLLLTVIPLLILLVGRTTGLFTAYGALDSIADLTFVFLLILGGVAGWHVSRRHWRGMIVGALSAAALGLVITIIKTIVEH